MKCYKLFDAIYKCNNPEELPETRELYILESDTWVKCDENQMGIFYTNFRWGCTKNVKRSEAFIASI